MLKEISTLKITSADLDESVSLADQALQVRLECLGRREWIERARTGKLRFATEIIERKKASLLKLEAAYETLQKLAGETPAIGEAILKK